MLPKWTSMHPWQLGPNRRNVDNLLPVLVIFICGTPTGSHCFLQLTYVRTRHWLFLLGLESVDGAELATVIDFEKSQSGGPITSPRETTKDDVHAHLNKGYMRNHVYCTGWLCLGMCFVSREWKKKTGLTWRGVPHYVHWSKRGVFPPGRAWSFSLLCYVAFLGRLAYSPDSSPTRSSSIGLPLSRHLLFMTFLDVYSLFSSVSTWCLLERYGHGVESTRWEEVDNVGFTPWRTVTDCGLIWL